MGKVDDIFFRFISFLSFCAIAGEKNVFDLGDVKWEADVAVVLITDFILN
jgi:hypothetical protein